MTTQQMALMLEQVQAIAGINGNLLTIMREVNQKDYDKLKPIVLRLLDVCDMINQIGSEASVDIEVTEPVNN